MRKRIAALAAAVAMSSFALAGSADAAPAHPATTAHQNVVRPDDGHGQGTYDVWTAVNFRSPVPACWANPSTWNCPLLGTIPAGSLVDVRCQDPGESINGNPYWLYVWSYERNEYGFIASYFVNNATNYIDHVPLCSDSY